METATFAAGCFWGIEARFAKQLGVHSTAVGYMGGHLENPNYQDVCTDTTGHAEVVQIEFDPQQVGYDDLLKVFWSSHNPTTLNRQGPDIGSQYRSAIFFHSPLQKTLAEHAKQELQDSGILGERLIVTQIVPAAIFNKAEEYHQQYLAKRGADSCHL